jgi:catecholate siderophore receptor
VRGVEVSVTGSVTERLSVQVGYTTMDAEILDSFNPANEGKTLSNFADNTGFAQVRYDVTPDLALGAAMKYESKKYAGQPDSAPAFNPETGVYSQPVPSYAVYDVFGSYAFNDKASLRLNVGNVTDKEYYLAAYRSGSFLYFGDARNVRLTFDYEL